MRTPPFIQFYCEIPAAHVQWNNLKMAQKSVVNRPRFKEKDRKQEMEVNEALKVNETIPTAWWLTNFLFVQRQRWNKQSIRGTEWWWRPAQSPDLNPTQPVLEMNVTRGWKQSNLLVTHYSGNINSSVLEQCLISITERTTEWVSAANI